MMLLSLAQMRTRSSSSSVRGWATTSQLETIHQKMHTGLQEKDAYLDGVYVCPHHPDFTGPCSCRKPKSGLLEQAQKEHDIVLTQSYMIGDTDRDIICGQSQGCLTISVETGHGIVSATPDYRVHDLYDAISLIFENEQISEIE